MFEQQRGTCRREFRIQADALERRIGTPPATNDAVAGWACAQVRS
jgi:hypothetical protein